VIFNRSGLAALSDLRSPGYQSVFSQLEKDQEIFLNKEADFRSKAYKWPRDPLHTWSRIWEYPYVYYHLAEYFETLQQDPRPIVADVGSGVTFFPFSLAKLGYQVVCADIDPICETDLRKAALCVPHEPGMVEFRLITEGILPFSDGEADIIYCISVLEHIPSFEDTISEMVRILRPGGLLVLTIDLDIRGDSELGIQAHKRLTSKLRQHFDYLYPDVTIHPADVLHSVIGPYAIKKPKGIELARYILKQRIVKPLLGKKPAQLVQFHLAIQGFAMTKRGSSG